VRLQGPAGNPTGVGAVVRLRFGERSGPAREDQPRLSAVQVGRPAALARRAATALEWVQR